MMIGEYEFEGIFTAHHDREKTEAENASDARNNPFPFYSGLIFIVFVFVMTIIIMNMLVGLAVDDIVTIQNNAQFAKLSLNVAFLFKSCIVHPLLSGKIGFGIRAVSATLKKGLEH